MVPPLHAVCEPPSSWQVNDASVSPAASKPNTAVVWLVGLAGSDVMRASGAELSRVNGSVAGEGSSLPTASLAATLKVCGPSAPVTVFGLVHGENPPLSTAQRNVAPGSGESKV